MSVDDPCDLTNATRELGEEMGIHGHKLTHVGNLKYENGHKVWFSIYLVRIQSDFKLKLQEREVEKVEKWSEAQILEKINEEGVKITPESVLCF